MLVSAPAAPLLPSPQVAWMNVPNWCKPARNSIPALFIKKISKSILFSEKNANSSLVKRIEYVVKRCFAALLLTLFSSLNLIAQMMKFNCRESLASLAVIFLSFGMVSGYLPPIAKNRLALEELPRGEDLYLNAKRACDGDECCAALALSQAKGIYHALATAVELGDSQAVEIFLKEGKANPNGTVWSRSLLTRAASNLHISTVRVLFKNGADPENVDGYLTPIVALLIGAQTHGFHGQAERKAKEKRCTPVEMARELVFQGVPFRNESIQYLGSLISAIKEKNKEELAYKFSYQLALIDAVPGLMKSPLAKALRGATEVDKITDYERELTKIRFAKEYYPHLVYISTILINHPHFPRIPVFETTVPEDCPSFPTEARTWVKAFKRCEDNGIVAHFEKVQDALLKAKTEIIWKRAQEITDACPTLPDKDIPTLISEYCYS